MAQNEEITELQDSQHLSYLINKNNMFFPTGYKVMQNQEQDDFVKCVKTLHNGKIKLIYDISNLKSLKNLLPKLIPETFLTILLNLVSAIEKIKGNGFIACENINISFDKIFVDCNNYKVFLIYLPIKSNASVQTFSNFENQIKINIIDAIKKYQNISNPFVTVVMNELQNNAISLEDIIKKLKLIIQYDNNALKIPNAPQADSNYTEKQAVSLENDKKFKKKTKKRQAKLKKNKLKPAKNKKKLLKYLAIAFIQIVAVGCILAVTFLIKLSYQRTLFGMVAILAADIAASILIAKFAFSQKKNSVGNTADFETKYEGGATQLLSDIFIPSLTLCGYNTPQKNEFVINKPEFTIGKNEDSVDAAILFDKAISRIHCKILYCSNQYYIEDEGSLNGTFVNETKIMAKSKVPIKAGDMIRLADCNFILKPL